MTTAARLAMLALVPLLSWSPQAQTFKSSIEAVRVDVLVTRAGRPVLGLTPGDFEVSDNGVPQRIDQAAFERVPLNLVIALDASSSVVGQRAWHLRAASHAVLDRLRPDERGALLAFGDDVVMRSPLTRDLSVVRAALDEPLPLGDTALIDASHAALLLAGSHPGRSLVIVFSDGVEVSSYLPAEAALDAAKRSDAVLYAVTLKKIARPPFLRQLTDASGGELLEIGSAAEIDTAFANVLEQFRHRYLFSYTPRGVERAGWHRLEVRVKRGGVKVRARPGYLRN